MKSFLRKMTKPLYVSFLLLFLASCNFSNDLPAINPLPVITDLPVKLTASFDIDSSTPKSLQNLVLQASENKPEASRSATASMPSNIQYFVTAETRNEPNPISVTVPADDIDETNKRFTINLRTGHTWRITVGIIDNDIDKIILSDYTDKDLTATNTDISHNFTLKPAITSGENGSIYLEINFDDPDYTVDITDEANAYSDWNTNSFGSGSTRTLNISSIPSGRYVLKIKFTKTNTIPFTATQVVTVYDNLKTDTWVSGGNALIDPTTNEFRLSNTIIAAANEGKKIYYVDGNTGGAGNDNNSGNINAPLQTIARAAALINAVGNSTDTYKIYVKGGTSETVANSIAIGGASANRKIELYTYLNSPTDGLGAVTLTRTSAINILTINNGSQLTINGGFTFDGAELEQAGINNSGTLTMNNGIVQKCYATGILNIGTFNLYGGSIINNRKSSVTNGGGIELITSDSCVFNVKGTINVYNNYKEDGTTPCNIFLPNSKFINVTGSIVSTDTVTSRIGVTTGNTPSYGNTIQITSGYGTHATPGNVFKGDLYGIKVDSGEACVMASGGALTEKYSDNVEITINGPATVFTGTSGTKETVTIKINGTESSSSPLTLCAIKSNGSDYNTDTYRTFSGNEITLLNTLVEGTYTINVKTFINNTYYTGAKTFRVVEKEKEVAFGIFDTTTDLSTVFCTGRTSVANIRSLIASTHEVTQGEYKQYCKFGGNQPNESYGLGDNRPAYFVSWYDAILYCNLKTINDPAFGSTEAERLNHCVYSLGGVKDPRLSSWGADSSDGKYCGPSSNNEEWNGITFDQNADGWRLPTEAEWEYLARGGKLSTTGQTDYSGSSIIGDVAWYKVNSKDLGESSPDYGMHEVCTKAHNDLGLYDMSGNVFEWCWDWYKETSPSIDINTPATGADPSSKRVRRGGSWAYGSAECAVSARGGDGPNSRYGGLGFRVVRNAN